MLNYAPSTGLEFLYSACRSMTNVMPTRESEWLSGSDHGILFIFNTWVTTSITTKKIFMTNLIIFQILWNIPSKQDGVLENGNSEPVQWTTQKCINIFLKRLWTSPIRAGNTKECLIIISAINFWPESAGIFLSITKKERVALHLWMKTTVNKEWFIIPGIISGSNLSMKHGMELLEWEKTKPKTNWFLSLIHIWRCRRRG